MVTEDDMARLRAVLDGIDALAVAVSGGVDSMTLATFAARHAPERTTMFHAVSAAVPPAATERVQALAAAEGWPLQLIVPGELEREAYVANPVDRCLHCKRALYTTIHPHTRAQIVSGANTDDLGDYRPGLRAAAESGVRHPLVEAGIGKAGVRGIARHLGLAEIAELPASPCLSSRVETGVRIVPRMLHGIDAAEGWLRARTSARNIRCRVRGAGLVIELDGDALDRLAPDERLRLARGARDRFGGAGARADALPSFEPYRTGSAFLRGRDD